MTILKSIVICLALANVGYFLWVRGIAHSDSVADVSAPQTTLKLVSEAPAGGHSASAGDPGEASGGLVAASGGPSGGPSGGARAEPPNPAARPRATAACSPT